MIIRLDANRQTEINYTNDEITELEKQRAEKAEQQYRQAEDPLLRKLSRLQGYQTFASYNKSSKPTIAGVAAGVVGFYGLIYFLQFLGIKSVPMYVAALFLVGAVVLGIFVRRWVQKKVYDPEMLAFMKLTPEQQNGQINDLLAEWFTYTDFHRETGLNAYDAGMYTNATREQAAANFEYEVFNKFNRLKGRTRASVFLRAPNGTTEIDVLHICQRGIFVVECKNMPGTLRGSQDDETLEYTHNGETTRIHNPLRQNHGHMLAVQAAIKAHLPNIWEKNILVYNVLVAPDETDFSGVKRTSDDTFLVHLSSIGKFMETLHFPDHVVLGYGDAQRIDCSIEAARLRGGAVREQHIRNIQQSRGQF